MKTTLRKENKQVKEDNRNLRSELQKARGSEYAFEKAAKTFNKILNEEFTKVEDMKRELDNYKQDNTSQIVSVEKLLTEVNVYREAKGLTPKTMEDVRETRRPYMPYSFR